MKNDSQYWSIGFVLSLIGVILLFFPWFECQILTLNVDYDAIDMAFGRPFQSGGVWENFDALGKYCPLLFGAASALNAVFFYNAKNGRYSGIISLFSILMIILPCYVAICINPTTVEGGGRYLGQAIFPAILLGIVCAIVGCQGIVLNGIDSGSNNVSNIEKRASEPLSEPNMVLVGNKDVELKPALDCGQTVVSVKEITYFKDGIVVFDGVQCNPNQIEYSINVIDKVKILSIKGSSVDGLPVLFEVRSTRKSMVSDVEGKLIKEFESKIRLMRSRSEAVDRLKSQIDPGLSPPCGLSLKKNERVLTYDVNVSFYQIDRESYHKLANTSHSAPSDSRTDIKNTRPVNRRIEEKRDVGTAVLTDKRFIFVGSNKTIYIDVNQSSNMNCYSDLIDTYKKGAKFIFSFRGLDGNLYDFLISNILR